MNPTATEILERARAGTEGATVARVFGTPIERDGVTIVPVAIVGGGGGGGGGGEGGGHVTDDGATEDTGITTDPDSPHGATGSGAGFGFTARPAGVYVIRDGEAHWRPAIDVNKIVIGGQLVAVAAFLLVRSILRHRR
ncbi:MAG TPA: sporulation protein [Actinoplanes sp.]|nr:sporulation protein [Actinoplanes sp.]